MAPAVGEAQVAAAVLVLVPATARVQEVVWEQAAAQVTVQVPDRVLEMECREIPPNVTAQAQAPGKLANKTKGLPLDSRCKSQTKAAQVKKSPAAAFFVIAKGFCHNFNQEITQEALN